MKIAVLLSGGVDSSVALRLLKDQGHDLTAFYLKIWLQEEYTYLGNCPWEDDLKYARAVCEEIDVPLKVLPLQTQYWDTVVTYTIAEMKAGRTPNPDIFCNSWIKFGEFYKQIDPAFTKIASGHYASVHNENGRYVLSQAPDAIKDQTYFLAYLKQEQLARALFPLGEYSKADVRALAAKYNLANQNRKDSQGICFLGQIKFSEFVKQHLGEKTGDIVDIDTGKAVGTHNGYWFYTIGQRQGLGLSGGPWYVVRKNVERNIIYISQDEHVEQRYQDRFSAVNLNWISGLQPQEGNGYQVKIRHGAHIYGCQLKYVNPEEIEITLDQPDQGIAQGQFAVIYKNLQCLGAGVIT